MDLKVIIDLYQIHSVFVPFWPSCVSYTSFLRPLFPLVSPSIAEDTEETSSTLTAPSTPSGLQRVMLAMPMHNTNENDKTTRYDNNSSHLNTALDTPEGEA